MSTYKPSPYTTSKMVVDRQRAAAELAAVLDRHAEEAQQALAAVIEPYLDEGEAAPDLFVLQKALRRRLVELDRDLVTADDTTIRERLEDRGIRRKRNAAVAELAHRLSRLRAGVEAAYGPGSAEELLEMEGPMPRDPVVLHRLGTRVVDLLRDDPFSGHMSQLRGIVLDASAWLPDLEEPLARLGDCLDSLVLEQRDSVSSLIRKKQAMRDYDVAYLSLARAFENLFRHVGLHELSQTVRPRRPTCPTQAEVIVEAEAQARRESATADAPMIAAEPWPELKVLDGGLGRRARPALSLDLPPPSGGKRDPTHS